MLEPIIAGTQKGTDGISVIDCYISLNHSQVSFYSLFVPFLNDANTYYYIALGYLRILQQKKMEFDAKQFVAEQVNNGKSLEKACLLLGFKSAIDFVNDMDEPYVSHKLNLVFKKMMAN